MPALTAPKAAGHHTDDRELVAAVRGGDERAFEVLYARYHPRIAAYVRGMVRDHGRAEDVTQEVFLSALRRMRETERDIAFRPWIYEIAKNACIDAFRRSRRTDEVSMDAEETLAADPGWLADTTRSPDTAMAAKQQLDDLRGAFGGLSDAHHEILVMRELEGLSYREIGERLGMSRPSVESTLFRARRRLSEEYEELATGERCRRVQGIIATAGARTLGARDQRRMARHISHCQPCRRHACLAGVDLRVPASTAAARVAALLPLPAFLRRRWGGEDGLLGHSGGTSVAQWSANVAGAMDPAAAVGWGKAVVAAATVAIAGVGAGAAMTEREAVDDLISRTPIARGPHAAGAAGAASAKAGPVTRAGGSSAAPAADQLGPAAARPQARAPGGALRGRAGAGTGTGVAGADGERAPGVEHRSGSGSLGGSSSPARPSPQPPTLKDVTDRLGLGAPPPDVDRPPGGTKPTTPDGDTPERPRPIRDLLGAAIGGRGAGSGAQAPAVPPPGTGTTAPDAPAGGEVTPPPDADPAPALPAVPGGGGAVGTVGSSVGATVDRVGRALAGR